MNPRTRHAGVQLSPQLKTWSRRQDSSVNFNFEFLKYFWNIFKDLFFVEIRIMFHFYHRQGQIRPKSSVDYVGKVDFYPLFLQMYKLAVSFSKDLTKK